ncbi:rhomboid family intramembrane serine protease [Luteibaculum oceani]|uniref:Rhomboid family intramembrane serine protease n=1 Tax=Luteibaculum oceani TaxID=1294296 RepID=A0A5C6V4J3_9FLAO|nr:rhomboid family intramembrane serine protease [Luteibaculum oceani]TXC78678.1 rhomboid family intramembrane serine protease [Luteibaculum oceani]
MNNFGGGFGGGINTRTVVINLIIINALVYFASVVFGNAGPGLSWLNYKFGLYLPNGANFAPYQLITHMFLHGGLMHIFFNMYALFLFGTVLERSWGPKRFLIFYLTCGFGAALIHLGVSYWEALSLKDELLNAGLSSDFLAQIRDGVRNLSIPSNDPSVIDAARGYFGKYNYPTVGASGAVFGLLLGFGMLFPNSELYLLFFPFPIKAKYFVIGYGLIELFSGVMNKPGDNVAHFAHLGGMIFGFILIKYWQKDRQNFY